MSDGMRPRYEHLTPLEKFQHRAISKLAADPASCGARFHLISLDYYRGGHPDEISLTGERNRRARSRGAR